MEIPDGLSVQTGEPFNVDACTISIYHFKAEILRNMAFEFGALLVSVKYLS